MRIDRRHLDDDHCTSDRVVDHGTHLDNGTDWPRSVRGGHPRGVLRVRCDRGGPVVHDGFGEEHRTRRVFDRRLPDVQVSRTLRRWWRRGRPQIVIDVVHGGPAPTAGDARFGRDLRTRSSSTRDIANGERDMPDHRLRIPHPAGEQRVDLLPISISPCGGVSVYAFGTAGSETP